MQNALRRNRSVGQSQSSADASFIQSFLFAVFGQECDFQSIPNLRAYADHVWLSINSLHSSLARDRTLKLGSHIGGSKEDTFTLVSQVLGFLQDRSSDHKLSIDDVVSLLTPLHVKERDLATAQPLCRQFVFLAIGLSTMLFTPSTSISLDNINVSRYDHGREKSRCISADISKRPIVSLLNGLGFLPSAPGSVIARDTESLSWHHTNGENLISANLTFSALNNCGHLTIQWIDSVDGHLVFNPDQHIVFLFRFPSFGAQAYKCGSDSLLAKLLLSRETSNQATLSFSGKHGQESLSSTLCRNVLQSYRLLFAQDAKSRSLYWTNARVTLREDSLHDALLDDLCGYKTSVVKKRHPELGHLFDIQNGIILPSQLSLYNQRLYKIHDYITRHRPRRFLEVWRDRRDPERYFTFWAVFVFGVASVVLSLVQIGFAAGQLWVGYEQLHQAENSAQ